MHDARVAPAVQLADVIDAVHPFLVVRNHDPATEELPELRSGEDPLHDHHLHPRGPRQVTELVVRSLGQNHVDLFERVEDRERIGDHGRVVVLLVELHAQVQQLVERAQELRATVRRFDVRHRPPHQREPVLMVVLVGAAWDRQAIALVLDPSPDEVVGSPQRIDVQVG